MSNSKNAEETNYTPSRNIRAALRKVWGRAQAVHTRHEKVVFLLGAKNVETCDTWACFVAKIAQDGIENSIFSGEHLVLHVARLARAHFSTVCGLPVGGELLTVRHGITEMEYIRSLSTLGSVSSCALACRRGWQAVPSCHH